MIAIIDQVDYVQRVRVVGHVPQVGEFSRVHAGGLYGLDIDVLQKIVRLQRLPHAQGIAPNDVAIEKQDCDPEKQHGHN